MVKYLLFFILFLFLYTGQSFAQEVEVSAKNITDEFNKARELAFSGNGSEARSICYDILNEKPKFYDARILIGRTFSWEKNFQSGREELEKVLTEDADNKDALFAIIDLEKWAGNPDKALLNCENGLSYYPNEETFLINKIKLLQELGEESSSFQVLDDLLELNPNNEEGLALLSQYKSSRMIYKAIYQHDYEYYKKPYTRKWHLSSFQLARRNSWGTLIGKINLGDLIQDGESFWSKGLAKQFEVDAYPRVSKLSYAYLNYGYSPDDLFPRHRMGAELYHKLPNEFEASAGFRYLLFDTDYGNEDIFTFTASLAKYYRNYWFSFRTYLTPNDGELSQSYWLAARRYLRNSKNYLGIELGTGVSPDETQIYSFNYLDTDSDTEIVSTTEVYKFKSRSLRLSYQDRLLTDRFLYLVKVGYEREEYQVSQNRNVFYLSVNLSYQF
ncbi:YaiO family outer membrane beta-barrel protein [Labilibaculum sp.]|uniref:YaiO family outer membrane beta-barrel protein n=1 Tax=Labilibaculum sp. TaxID=2060723 RepID=UPI003561DCE5